MIAFAWLHTLVINDHSQVPHAQPMREYGQGNVPRTQLAEGVLIQFKSLPFLSFHEVAQTWHPPTPFCSPLG